MLMAMMAMYAFLFMVAYALIKPADQAPGVQMKAEYMLTLEWPGGNLDDIDLHLLLPDGKAVDFHHREVEHAMLDHDDVGTNGVYVGADGGRARVAQHREMVTLRAIVPGTYVANVHVYRVNRKMLDWQSEPTLPYPATIRLTRLNPRVQDVASVDVTLTREGEQRTAFAFTIAAGGGVSVDRDADVPFITTVPKLSGA
jgi:hypothetical protein